MHRHVPPTMQRHALGALGPSHHDTAARRRPSRSPTAWPALEGDGKGGRTGGGGKGATLCMPRNPPTNKESMVHRNSLQATRAPPSHLVEAPHRRSDASTMHIVGLCHCDETASPGSTPKLAPRIIGPDNAAERTHPHPPLKHDMQQRARVDQPRRRPWCVRLALVFGDHNLA